MNCGRADSACANVIMARLGAAANASQPCFSMTMPRGSPGAMARRSAICAGSNDITAAGPPIAGEAALHFDEQRGPAGDQVAQFAERDHAVAGRLEGGALELRGRRRVEPA